MTFIKLFHLLAILQLYSLLTNIESFIVIVHVPMKFGVLLLISAVKIYKLTRHSQHITHTGTHLRHDAHILSILKQFTYIDDITVQRYG